MPVLEIEARALVVRLGRWESMLALHGDVRVSLAQIRSVSVVEAYGGRAGLKFGWRLPGTHIPFVVAAGTFVRHGERQFVFIRRSLKTIVIKLEHKEWTRLVIGVPDAHAQAARIEDAVARYRDA